MPDPLDPHHLDEILALQLTVAWAGEAAGDPPRLGWWRSDLVDPEGGGDLFARLVPKTRAWTSLILVRDAARRVEEAARAHLTQSDKHEIRSLFHLGFKLDEKLDDRLAQHRREQREPADVLGARFLVGRPWKHGDFESLLAGLGKPRVEVTSTGRRLSVARATAVEKVALFAAALLPLTPAYPFPYAEEPA